MASQIQPADRPPRLLSLDVYRGLIMCLLAVNGLALAATAKRLGYGPDASPADLTGRIWQSLAFHNSHPHWNSQFYVLGCSFWDLIQPAFMFMVGVAMPYSYASRKQRGDSNGKLISHAFVRSIVLVLLGVFLATRTTGLESNRMLTNVLAQIGLGYFFVFLLLGRSAKLQVACGTVVLVGYSIFLTYYPVVEPQPDASIASAASLSVPDSIATQYAIHTNGAARADVWILGLEQGDKPLQVHPAGYATLNFIPASVTMLLGLLAGTLLRSQRSDSEKIRRLLLSGLVCMSVAIAASYTLCPIVKKIWTPAWTLYSGAWVIWMLALLYWVIDVLGLRRWTWPLVIVGMNSLAMYLMFMLMKGWIIAGYKTYLGKDVFTGVYGPTLQAIAVFVVLWLICLYLYRNKIFFRI
ncbi:MAG: DUF5009 domain-containing protein [Pirellulaceae bacterium]|nr:DUF5009 domain-containing protein [Pirellulaceae bacterium]